MVKAKWDEVAEKQFEALDKDWQEDWSALRDRVMHN